MQHTRPDNTPVHYPHDPTVRGRSVLIFERGFLRPRRRKPIHGVELFRIGLIRDLLALGVRVTILCERSWKERILERLGTHALSPGLQFLTALYLRKQRPTGWVLSRRVTKMFAPGAFDTLLLGDPNRPLTGSARRLMRCGVAKRSLVMAHGRGRASMLRSLRDETFDVHAVSEHVADEFRPLVGGAVSVGYGLTNAHQFTSATPVYERERDGDAPVRVCLLARLPSGYKGEPTAVAAFRALPAEVRARCELHLAGYLEPPKYPEPNIVTHPWVANDRVAEFLGGMDVLLVPSVEESFCQSMVQGMLMGLPIVSSPLEVLIEKLDTGGGMVCAEVPEYAAALAHLIENADARRTMGRSARAAALDRYIWDTERFADTVLFKDLGSRRSSG